MTDRDSPEQVVRRWMDDQGYPLEFATARAFRDAGFVTEQGHYFRDDRDTPPKLREVDVVGRLERPRDGASVRVVIECKRSSVPWVVMTEERPIPIVTVIDCLAASPAAIDVLRDRATRTLKAGSPIPDLLVMPPRYGFGLLEAATCKAARAARDDESGGPYFAMRKITAAATQLLAQPGQPALSVVLAVLVIDAPLLQFGFREDRSEVLERVQWQRMLWRGTSGTPLLVDVVSLDGLDHRARVLFDGASQLSGALSAHLSAISGYKPPR